MYEDNAFITLTYSDENLQSDRLNYRDFQLFAKKLRRSLNPDHKIGIFVTGEYGDRTKRPHWHALLFNWRPRDCEFKYQSDRGDRVYSSKSLDKLWGKGITEVGSVTFESAGYCARYAAKKLVHGKDDEHEFHPISKKSSHQAIGKKFIEKYWKDIFSHGKVILPSGDQTSIPRYYEKWLQKHEPQAWLRYVTEVKAKVIREAEARESRDELEYWRRFDARPYSKPNLITKKERLRIISEERFKRLQKYLKGEI